MCPQIMSTQHTIHPRRQEHGLLPLRPPSCFTCRRGPSFTTVIGRCITTARVLYYKAPGRSFPDNAKCVHPAIPEGKAYPGAELILTPPATPGPVLIDEGLVSNMLIPLPQGGHCTQAKGVICKRFQKGRVHFGQIHASLPDFLN